MYESKAELTHAKLSGKDDVRGNCLRSTVLYYIIMVEICYTIFQYPECYKRADSAINCNLNSY